MLKGFNFVYFFCIIFLFLICFILVKIFLKKIGFSILILLNLNIKVNRNVIILLSVRFKRFDLCVKEINSFYKVFIKLKNYWYLN